MASNNANWEHNQRVFEELKPGDLVKFERGSFYHWAVYIGEGQVCHLAGLEEGGLSNNIRSGHFLSVSGVPYKKAKVCIEDFWEVAGKSRAYKGNDFDKCYQAYDAKEIVKRAKSKLGTVDYHFFSKNCEHFANWCRYGVEESGQSNKLKNTGRAIIDILGCALRVSPLP